MKRLWEQVRRRDEEYKARKCGTLPELTCRGSQGLYLEGEPHPLAS